jgi:hypothetical protein
MELVFSWESIFGRLCPSARSASMPEALDPLSCLLMDDGGLDFETTLVWLDEGIARTDSVISEGEQKSSWDREDWGAELTPEAATVYSLHDETVREVVAILQFRTVLSAWREFVVSTPRLGFTRKVELGSSPTEP